MRNAFLLAAATLALALPTVAHAQDNAPRSGPVDPNPELAIPGDRVTIGVGAASIPDYEGADQNQIIPGAVAIGTLGGYDFFTRGTQLYVDLVKDPAGPGTKFEFGPIVAARFQRNSAKGIKNDQVRALGAIDAAYEVGASIGIARTGVITSDFDTLTARVGFVHDVSGSHGSYVVTPQINYSTPLSYATLVGIGASADYVGKGFGRTYFGVTPSGMLASGLRSYDVRDSGFKNIDFSAFVLQSLSGDLRRGLAVGGGLLHSRLLGDYKNSPLVRDVGDKSTWYGAVGLAYTF
ncbi:MipA/OmpV family protein [Sphingomonas sp.]|uniref:MipA/OmpV family protein n=1 Tax=Sphingomonas sp. TaxID=28214 RepID=UPI002ED8C810